MFRYILKRSLGALPTLLVIMTLAFFLIRLAPGGPFDSERPVLPEIAANLERAYHLDQPLPVQYGYYLLNILQGDFGPSFKYKDHTVSELIAEGFPVSLQLGLSAMLLALLVGIPAGMLAALRQNQPLDHAVMALAMTGITIPNFVMAPLLALVFGVFLHWLPVAGWDGGWKSAVLPVVALALPQIAYAARMMRASMLETLGSPHIRTAFAKGLPLRLVLWRHVLKGALLPLVSWLGPATAAIITGSVVIEQIFSIPGIGRHFVQGALNRDYTLVMGVVVFYGGLIIVMNLLVDVVYGLLDPRVRYE
ncbi:MAG TPA: oligopeptide ABC transporter permease OppB [Candidatus Thiothrix moscowensis]|uniref:oligopeptide ABC transporter permease OppB n=1 Tax=unclassified Thiothrix TaxID=2636184 RepID=UPI0025DB5AED|nr:MULTISPECIES: oligopeptide ABC transporter permease OppB [unclassified Thiothrix]HRJ54207.1 oligopeptide ABC transporter permease OppB [Candidatus Thiothrix moscowensis]HRJ94473.1 oligopeptide ABC transporter permease OppB [Candidatus Thiothrix moscowensis]